MVRTIERDVAEHSELKILDGQHSRLGALVRVPLASTVGVGCTTSSRIEIKHPNPIVRLPVLREQGRLHLRQFSERHWHGRIDAGVFEQRTDLGLRCPV
jgi:hypothetical protein